MLASDQEKVLPFIQNSFSLEHFANQIELKKNSFSTNSREILQAFLQEFYSNKKQSSAVQLNIEGISNPKCFTLTTGHQLNVFTGPVFMIYKILHVIRLSEELKKEYPNASLCMVGPDKENLISECKKLAKKRKVTVTFTGLLSKEDWVLLSNDYTIFINTSHYDNTPVSLIEAMAVGLPIVTTNVGGIPYLVKDKENALLVNDTAVFEMVDAVKLLLNNTQLTQELIRNSRKLAEEFDWEKVKQHWSEILK